jgi:hypothetical protein
MINAATLIISNPPSPSSKESSCGAMPENHASGDIPLGGDEIRRDAELRASREILGPLDWAACDCWGSAFWAVLGCTESINSIV